MQREFWLEWFVHFVQQGLEWNDAAERAWAEIDKPGVHSRMANSPRRTS
jgi:hypothetical protein